MFGLSDLGDVDKVFDEMSPGKLFAFGDDLHLLLFVSLMVLTGWMSSLRDCLFYVCA